jgi:hypothetical protein
MGLADGDLRASPAARSGAPQTRGLTIIMESSRFAIASTAVALMVLSTFNWA